MRARHWDLHQKKVLRTQWQNLRKNLQSSKTRWYFFQSSLRSNINYISKFRNYISINQLVFLRKTLFGITKGFQFFIRLFWTFKRFGSFTKSNILIMNETNYLVKQLPIYHYAYYHHWSFIESSTFTLRGRSSNKLQRFQNKKSKN